jgi:hypothetical protein
MGFIMNQNNVVDFGALYRSAFAERDPQRKQILLSQVQKAIRNTEQDETVSIVKLSPQSLSSSKIGAIA